MPVEDVCDMSVEAFQEFLRRTKKEEEVKEETLLEVARNTIMEKTSTGGMLLLELFPKEIWAMIVDELNPEDRDRMREVDEVFLGFNRNQDILYSLVMDKIFTSKIKPAFRDVLKKLRLVSRDLRNRVDDWIPNQIVYIMRSSRSVFDVDSIPKHEYVLTENVDELNKLLIFSTGPVDQRPERLFLRSLKFVIKKPNTNNFQQFIEIFRRNTIEFLRTVGEQVLVFQLMCKDLKDLEKINLTTTEIYMLLRQWLNLMPNLKWLNINLEEIRRTFYLRVGARIEGHPMPTLNNLERVDFEFRVLKRGGVESKALLKFEQILNANTQVKYHYYYPCSHAPRFTKPAILGLHLETALLEKCSPVSPAPPGYVGLHQIASTNCSWKLKKLELAVKNEDFNLNPIFECLNKFPTLEHVSLDIKDVSFGREEVNFLRLLALKRFELAMSSIKFDTEGKGHLFFSLLFLLHSRKLESLTFIHDISRDALLLQKHKKGMPDFRGGVGDLRISNVWSMFPKLRDIKVRFFAADDAGDMRLCFLDYRNKKLVQNISYRTGRSGR